MLFRVSRRLVVLGTLGIAPLVAACGAILGFDKDFQEVDDGSAPGDDAEGVDGSTSVDGAGQDSGNPGNDSGGKTDSGGGTDSGIRDTGTGGDASCKPLNQPCFSGGTPCCQGLSRPAICVSQQCQLCGQATDDCFDPSACCTGFTCRGNNRCSSGACTASNGSCQTNTDCCSGLTCFPDQLCHSCLSAGAVPDAGANECCSNRTNDAGACSFSGN
jgi:hypothetical protein